MDTETIAANETITQGAVPRTIGLTVLLHPDVRRIGDVAMLTEMGSRGRSELSRFAPDFHKPRSDEAAPLDTPYVSRKPIVIETPIIGGVRLSCERSAQLKLNEKSVHESQELDDAMIRRGVVLVIGDAVVLLLHLVDHRIADTPDLEMIGENPEMNRLRANILRVADLDVPVLIQGETGVGKELVAQAIHNNSNRSDRAYYPVNMAAIPEKLATRELFGAEKGAHDGAQRFYQGYFLRAHNGTLFLDEIGDIAPEIQPMLLRAIEQGQIQVLGSEQFREVDVRIITATDVNLRSAVEAGTFKLPLLQRLSGYELHVPPLRHRRDDIGRLFYHFIEQELARTGELSRLEPPAAGRKFWIPAKFIARLAAYDWPGNVRQLRNVVRQLVITNRGETKFRSDKTLERLLDEPKTPEQDAQEVRVERKKRRASESITDEEIISALRKHGFNISAAAVALGASRTWLFTRMERCDRIRKAADIGADEILNCQERCDGDIEQMAQSLEVSQHGLKQRMKQLNLSR